QPWPAIGAVEKRVTEPLILGVRQLCQTVGTDSHVWRDEDRTGRVRVARLNPKLPFPANCSRLPGQSLHPSQGRRPSREFLQEAVQGRSIALDFDEDVPRLILDTAAEAQARGQAKHEGPKSDPLNDALNLDRPAFHSWSLYRRQSRTRQLE